MYFVSAVSKNRINFTTAADNKENTFPLVEIDTLLKFGHYLTFYTSAGPSAEKTVLSAADRPQN